MPGKPLVVTDVPRGPTCRSVPRGAGSPLRRELLHSPGRLWAPTGPPGALAGSAAASSQDTAAPSAEAGIQREGCWPSLAFLDSWTRPFHGCVHCPLGLSSLCVPVLNLPSLFLIRTQGPRTPSRRILCLERLHLISLAKTLCPSKVTRTGLDVGALHPAMAGDLGDRPFAFPLNTWGVGGAEAALCTLNFLFKCLCPGSSFEDTDSGP